MARILSPLRTSRGTSRERLPPAVQLQQMTWGAAFAEESGTTLIPFAIGLQSGGSVTVLWQDNGSSPDRFKSQVWNGATWSALVDVCAGAEALPNFNAAVTVFPIVAAVLDAANVLHVIYGTSSSDPTWNNRFFYQEVTGANALQNFQEFPGQSGAHQDLAAIIPSRRRTSSSTARRSIGASCARTIPAAIPRLVERRESTSGAEGGKHLPPARFLP